MDGHFLTDFRRFAGCDSRVNIIFQAAKQSFPRNTSIPAVVVPIKQQELVEMGLCSRDNDPLATAELAYWRFFTHYFAVGATEA